MEDGQIRKQERKLNTVLNGSINTAVQIFQDFIDPGIDFLTRGAFYGKYELYETDYQ